MSNNSAMINYETESKSAQLLPDDTQNTDFTQIASCAFGEKPAEPGDRKARADFIEENIAMEESRPFSIKDYICHLLGLK